MDISKNHNCRVQNLQPGRLGLIMQKWLLAACIFSSVGVFAENLSKLPTHLISKYEWEQFLSHKTCSDDIVVLVDGTRLCGQIEKIPPISFSFGNLIFTPTEVAAIALIHQAQDLKIQYITRDGQDYLGSLARGKFIFNVLDHSEGQSRYTKKEIDPQAVHFIILREREYLNSPYLGSVSSLDLNNGDHLPVIIQEEPIVLTDGWHDKILRPSEILEISFNGGVQGRILQEGLPTKLNFMFVKEPFLKLRILKNGQTLKMPWNQIEYIEAHNGGFKRSPPHELTLEKFVEEPKVPVIEMKPDSIGNNSGTLLEGAQGTVALEPSAFDGLELIGADLMYEVKPLFDPAEEEEWKLEIAFEDMNDKNVKVSEPLAMLDKDEFRQIAESLIYEDIKKVDVDPATFDVQPIEEISKKSLASFKKVDWDKKLEKETPPPKMDPELSEILNLSYSTLALLDEMMEEQKHLRVYDENDPFQETTHLTEGEKELLHHLLADFEETKETSSYPKKLIFIAEEEMNTDVANPDSRLQKSTLIPTQGSPTWFIKAPALYLDLHPVTNGEYASFVKDTGHHAPVHWINGQIPAGQENKPVVNVSYKDAADYAAWQGRRLPTETEWKRALNSGVISQDQLGSLKEWTSTTASANSKVIFTGSVFQPRNENWVDHSTGFRTVSE